MVTETLTPGTDWTVPAGIIGPLTVTLEGEAGDGPDGGKGGRVVAEMAVSAGDTLYIRSSSGGSAAPDSGYEGGDSVDIRVGGTTLSDRAAVAAGGGGQGTPDSASDINGGDGGGALFGGDGGSASGFDMGGDGGGPNSGGAGGSGSSADGTDGGFGFGGNGTFDDNTPGAGGGAGWYGGGGGGSNSNTGAAGGGGSNYVGGVDESANEGGTSTRSHGDGGAVTIEYDPQPPAQNLQLTDSTETTHTLEWDVPPLLSGVTSLDLYRVYRATEPGETRADYTEISTTTSPGYEDTGLTPGVEYHYRVGADVTVAEENYQITVTGFSEN